MPVLNGVMDPTEMKNRIIAYLTANAGHAVHPHRRHRRRRAGLMALDELGLTGKVKIGTFDLSPTILQATADGKMEWGIDAQQYAMGYIPVVMFDLWKKYKIAPIADYPTGPGFVTKDDGGFGDRPRQAGQAVMSLRRAGSGVRAIPVPREPASRSVTATATAQRRIDVP